MRQFAVIFCLLLATAGAFAHPKVDILVEEYLGATPFALAPMAEGDRITLAVETIPGFSWPEEYTQYVRDSIGDTLWKVVLPSHLVYEVADLPGVKWVRFPYTPIPLGEPSRSEGVELIGADEYHARGITGSGVRISILDVGFHGYEDLVAQGKLTNLREVKDYHGCGCRPQSPHGAACAEVAWDMAPDAEFYLQAVGSEFSLDDAVEDAIDWGVRIISHSVGWLNSNFYDGTGPICRIVNKALNAGILWVNAAGNMADGMHWYGEWVDEDHDRYLDFAPGDNWNEITVKPGVTIIWLAWDKFPETDMDFDIHLRDPETGQIVWRNGNRQQGEQYPTEAVGIQTDHELRLEIGIYEYNAPEVLWGEEVRFHLFASRPISLEYDTPKMSILTPGEMERVVTVGAISVEYWQSGPQEPFSSRGPTTTGLRKPDLMGPDRVTSSIYGSFAGTSAATPHIAGAAALLLSEDPSLSAEELRDALEERAVDMGEPGPDNIYGLGRLQLASWLGEEHTHTYSGPTGWYMVGTPASAPKGAFSETVYEWDPQEAKYRSVDILLPFHGYWAYLPANKTVTVYGPSQDYAYLPLPSAGWWMISCPFELPKENILLSVEGGEWLYWNDAVRHGYVADTIWHYEPSWRRYRQASVLEPWDGYWIYLSRPATLLLREGDPDAPPPPPFATKGEELLRPPPPPAGARTEGVSFFCEPNPITDVHTATIGVRGSEVAWVEVSVFDLSGRLVWKGEAKGNSVLWHTEDLLGRYLANGAYICHVIAHTRDGGTVSGLFTIAVLR